MLIHIDRGDADAYCGVESCRGHKIIERDPIFGLTNATCIDCIDLWKSEQILISDRINNATKEEIAQAMDKLDTKALEWAVRFEALSHKVNKE